jgi:hypothetical protein
MSNEYTRNRGNLFENLEKKKPSQPDFHGDCTIDSVAYEICGYRREDQLTVTLAPPRGDRNTYPPDVFRGALEAVPVKPTRKGVPKDTTQPAWVGEIKSEDAAYTVRAVAKQGKSGTYFVLEFEPLESEPEGSAEP